jgi:hypothetical protein
MRWETWDGGGGRFGEQRTEEREKIQGKSENQKTFRYRSFISKRKEIVAIRSQKIVIKTNYFILLQSLCNRNKNIQIFSDIDMKRNNLVRSKNVRYQAEFQHLIK